MKRIEAPCPACGAPVEFRTSHALVTICDHCRSVVARGDRRLEDHGKMAALVQTDSPLRLGLTGKWRDHRFDVIGHVQYRHPAGGVWEEWHISLPGQRWAWIAEAQGKIYFTAQKETKPSETLPAFGDLSAGQRLNLGRLGLWDVAEFGTASLISAEGELPYDFYAAGGAGRQHRFADLTGVQKGFATLDFNGEKPRFFVGVEVTLADLGLSAVGPSQRQTVNITAKQVNCPKCAGALTLRAPDQTLRVTCPYCSALIDVEEGNLKYLMTLAKGTVSPDIPIGTLGTLRGTPYLVIGFLHRSVTYDTRYTWDEYLLYAPPTGAAGATGGSFRWLVHSDHHWTFVEPVSISELSGGDSDSDGSQSGVSPGGPGASGVYFNGNYFRLFQRAWAKVEHVLGEFYWKVAAGEIVLCEDFVAPPLGITLEYTPANLPTKARRLKRGDGWAECQYQEVIASLGTYLSHEEVEQAFALEPLQRGWGVAPNQPVPAGIELAGMWVAFAMTMVVIDLLLGAVKSEAVDHWVTFWFFAFVTAYPVGAFLYNQSFERSRWAESEFSPYEAAE